MKWHQSLAAYSLWCHALLRRVISLPQGALGSPEHSTSERLEAKWGVFRREARGWQAVSLSNFIILGPADETRAGRVEGIYNEGLGKSFSSTGREIRLRFVLTPRGMIRTNKGKMKADK